MAALANDGNGRDAEMMVEAGESGSRSRKRKKEEQEEREEREDASWIA